LINARRFQQVAHFKPKVLFPSLAFDWSNYCPDKFIDSLIPLRGCRTGDATISKWGKEKLDANTER
jgi:hypothetical protein